MYYTIFDNITDFKAKFAREKKVPTCLVQSFYDTHYEAITTLRQDRQFGSKEKLQKSRAT